MKAKDLLVQLNQKRTHLDSLTELLNSAIQLKKGRLGFVNDSVQRLSCASAKNPQSLGEISHLIQQLGNNRRMYGSYESDIVKYETEIEVTKKEIEALEQQLLEISPDKKAYLDFYKRKKRDPNKDEEGSQNFNLCTTYISVKGVMSSSSN